MNPLPSTLLAELASIVGPDWVISDADRLLVYESDAQTAHNVAPQAVVLPIDTDEASRVAQILHRHRVPLVPRGSGTGLSGGALATEGGVVVGTSRMNRILEVDPENRRAVVQSGVLNTDLSHAAAPFGLHYAPDPSSQTACTIGGNVAENSGGPHCLKYGVTTRYITGLRVVLVSGETVWLGGQGREAPTFDLVGLFVGSEGCFGLATEVEVALVPVPEATRTLLAIFETLEDAGRAVTAIVSAGLLPAALEIVDQNTIKAVEASIFAAGYPTDAGAALVVEFDGVEAGLALEAEEAERFCRAAGAREVRRAESSEERVALWKGRKKAFGTMGRLAPDLLVQDATVPRTRLPEVLSRIAEIAERYQLQVANVFHAGDGNLHPNIVFDRRDAEETRKVEAASKEIMGVCVDAGGTITGEHGVGADKQKYMPLVFSPHELEVLRRVKGVFDPEGRCNPGKVVPPPDQEEGAGS
ncbi:MAG: FAD-binding protein [Gemmatimonadetes bacterium]|nr:FAD-binding protein [Gemmatimonadota bacterium]NNM06773.1 FAD-binding protein [Gemmatimonadota bacterium]